MFESEDSLLSLEETEGSGVDPVSYTIESIADVTYNMITLDKISHL